MLGEVGFLDLFYDNKSVDTILGIKHASKDIYFRNITIFINHIKDVARSKAELLRNNL